MITLTDKEFNYIVEAAKLQKPGNSEDESEKAISGKKVVYAAETLHPNPDPDAAIPSQDLGPTCRHPIWSITTVITYLKQT